MSSDFIKMVSEIHNQRYSNQILYLIQNKINCGFFVGFEVPNNISEVISSLKETGINLQCVCVIDESQINDTDLDIPTITMEELPNFQTKPEIMLHFNDFQTNAFREYFLRFGIDTFALSDANNLDNRYNFYMQNLPNIYEAYKILEDEESKKVFLAAIKGNVTNSISDFRFAPEPQYFLEGFLPVEGDIAIDGGSFDGATSRDFSMQGAKVYAFEMDAQNYQNCLPRAEKYNFVIENLGLSYQEGKEFYYSSGTGSLKGYGDVEGNFIDLDTYVNRKNLPRVDYIKLDIEGAELDMLHGAAKTISRWKPKMAVSAYHKLEDMWTLALYIKSIRPDYKFQFRHYKVDCTDYTLNDSHRAILRKFGLSYFLPSTYEKVLYCK